MLEAEIKSPFKFLDSYDKEDKEKFFGRSKETAQLYNAVFANNLTLLYGGSGTGKTSLVNCGLGNKFYDTDWFPIFIRRETGLIKSIKRSLRSKLMGDVPEGFDDWTLREKISKLYTQYYKPIYLIFDQFEEIYILGTKEEQHAYYEMICDLLRSDLQAKVLIIIREEWIAFMNEFERRLPTLFDNRLRIEKMNDLNIYRVVAGTCKYEGIKIDDPGKTVLAIIENLRDKREGIDLTNLQVYLDRLYRKAVVKQNGNTENVVFDLELVKEVGKIENVLSEFLDEQLVQIEKKLEKRGVKNTNGLPLEILFTMVTDDGTKQQLTSAEIINELPKNRKLSESDLEFCMNEFKNIKIMRQLN